MLYCVKLKKMAEGLKSPPFPGERGQKVFESISAEAWKLWLNQQTMLINEYRLNLLDPKARAYLQESAMAFLFEDRNLAPPGYAPKET